MCLLRASACLLGLALAPGCLSASTPAPSVAFDHVWIHVAPGAPEADALVDAGFELPPPRRHTGMGTASTVVFFENAYLELIWVTDAQALERVGPEFAHALLGGPDTSPFGIGLRRATDRDELPFDTTSVSAAWIEPGEFIHVARWPGDSRAGPPVFVVPRYMAYPEFRDEFAGMATNRLGLREVTRARVRGPGSSSSHPALADLTVPDVVRLVPAEGHLLELEFDGRAREAALDFRPELPLVIRF